MIKLYKNRIKKGYTFNIWYIFYISNISFYFKTKKHINNQVSQVFI